MENNLYIAKMVKRNGKLEYVNPNDRNLFIKNVEGLREGAVVEQVVDFTPDSGKSGQIARVHQLIGKISKEIGDPDGAVKKEIKSRAGLVKPNGEVKSFANCSEEELAFAIECAISLGDFIGMQLR
jgi:hypothetical protein